MPPTFPLPLGEVCRRILLRGIACLVLPSSVPAIAIAQRSHASRVPVNFTSSGSFGPSSVSADGRLVAYYTIANDGSTQVSEIYVRDRFTGALTTLGLQSTPTFSYIGIEALSHDGRFLVLMSDSSALVPNDTNNTTDIFLYDRETQQYRRVNVGPSGQQSAYSSAEASISGDGRYVVFTGVPDILPGVSGGSQVMLYDRITQQVSLASRHADGSAGGGSNPSISGDGRYVAFSSYGALVPADTNGSWDVYVYDRVTGGETLVSLSPTGSQGTASITRTAISGNGRFVVWEEWGDAPSLLPGDANGSFDLLVRDRDADQDGIFDEAGAVRTFRVSETLDGVVGNAHSFVPTISDSGRIIGFVSGADNLLGAGVDVNQMSDAFVVDLDGDGDGVFLEPGDRRISRVSVADDGRPIVAGAGGSFSTTVNSDGRQVFFASCANDITADDSSGCDLFVVDRLAQNLKDLVTPTTRVLTPQTSGDGTWTAFASSDATLVTGDTNGGTDVFVRDRRQRPGDPGATVRVSVTTGGAQALGGASDQPSISSDGRFIVFRSAATNLVTGDTNGVADIFLHDRDTDQDGVYDEPGARATARVNVATGGGAPVGGASETPRISSNGQYIVYTSSATNLTPGASPFRQAYFYDRVNGITVCASEHNGVKANAHAVTPAVSNGRRVAFATAATNLSSIDGNALSDVYDVKIEWPYTAPRTVRLVSIGPFGAGAGVSTSPALSPGGRLAFVSTAPLSFSDSNNVADVYLESFFSVFPYFTTSTVFLRLSEGAEGGGNGPSDAPSVSDSGAISFTSAASNLVFRDTNGVDDVFRIFVATVGGGTKIPFQEMRSRLSRVSLLADGSESPTQAGASSISADGQHIEFEQALASGGFVLGRRRRGARPRR